MDAEPDDALLELVKGARGSPFLLMELLSGLRDEDLIRVVAGQAELVEARLPRRVESTMRERLRGVSAPAREAATVAASLGRRFSFADLANMLDRPAGDAARAGGGAHRLRDARRERRPSRLPARRHPRRRP